MKYSPYELFDKSKYYEDIMGKLVKQWECILETGRTHQIRVHLSYHHFPIINNPLYGAISNRLNVMGLFSYGISLWHPLNNSYIDIKMDMKEIFSKLKIKEIDI